VNASNLARTDDLCFVGRVFFQSLDICETGNLYRENN
jgi:hypothetical protein